MSEEAGQEVALPPAEVEALFQTLAKAVRARQLYLPNNPMHQQAMERLRSAFAALWNATDELSVDVGEAELYWEGSPVYSSETRSESIAFLLYKDGVRSITFQKGIEETELDQVLDVLHRARTLRVEDSDDLLTILWEHDFKFFQYSFQDVITDISHPLPESSDVEPPSTPTEVVQQAVEEEVPRTPAGIVRSEDFDTTLYFLDDQEIEFVQKEVREEFAQDLRRNVLSMVFDVMELQPYATVRSELISILDNFMPYLLGASDFRSVTFVLREARAVASRARELMPEHKEVLEALPDRLSEEATLSQLLQALDEAAVHPEAAELNELFAELRPAALPTLFAWLPRLTNQRVLEVVEGSVLKLAASNPQTLINALGSADAAVLLTAARLVTRLKLSQAVPGLAEALGHREPAVRVAAVSALSEIATPSAVQALEKGLDDAERDVRIACVKVVAQHRSRSALPKITDVVTGKNVRAMDLTEKMSFFEAYGMLVGDGGVKVLDEMLNGSGLVARLMGRVEDSQTRACAAMALGTIGTQAARVCLQKAIKDKDPLVRNATMRALRGERASALFKAGMIPQ